MVGYIHELYQFANGTFFTIFFLLATITIIMEKLVIVKFEGYNPTRSLESMKNHVNMIIITFALRIVLYLTDYSLVAEIIMLALVYDYITQIADLAESLGWKWLTKGLKFTKIIKEKFK